jgi:acyl carrier protein
LEETGGEIFACRAIACNEGRWAITDESNRGVPVLANQIENIEAEVLRIVSERIPPGIQVSPQTRIARDLGLDSVAVMDFVMDIEDHFDISIPLDRVAEVETVEDLSRAVEALLKEKG